MSIMGLMILSIASSVLVLIMHHSNRPPPQWMKARAKVGDMESKNEDHVSDANFASSDLRYIAEYVKKKEKEEQEHDFWVKMASKLDLFLLFLFSLATLVITVVLLGIYPLTTQQDVEPQIVSWILNVVVLFSPLLDGIKIL